MGDAAAAKRTGGGAGGSAEKVRSGDVDGTQSVAASAEQVPVGTLESRDQRPAVNRNAADTRSTLNAQQSSAHKYGSAPRAVVMAPSGFVCRGRHLVPVAKCMSQPATSGRPPVDATLGADDAQQQHAKTGVLGEPDWMHRRSAGMMRAALNHHPLPFVVPDGEPADATPRKIDCMALANWTHKEADPRCATLRAWDQVYMFTEEYAYETVAQRCKYRGDELAQSSGQHERLPDEYGERKLPMAPFRLALVSASPNADNEEETDANVGYVPRAYLMPWAPFIDLLKLPPWYCEPIAPNVAHTQMLDLPHTIGTFVVHENRNEDGSHCKLVFGWPTYSMHIYLPDPEDATAAKAAAPLCLIWQPIMRDPFGRYVLQSYPNAPFESLWSLASRCCGCGLSDDEWRDVQNRGEAPFKFWLRGGPEPAAINNSAKCALRITQPDMVDIQPELEAKRLDGEPLIVKLVENGTFARLSVAAARLRCAAFAIDPTAPANEQGIVGEGNFSKVYKMTYKRAQLGTDADKATHEQAGLTDGQTVAAKKIVVRQGSASLLREVSLCTRLVHANLVRTYGAAVDASQLCIYSEFVPHGDLASYLRKAQSAPAAGGSAAGVPWPAKLSALADVASAMCYVHEQRVVHCDLAARNCLVARLATHSAGLLVKLSDFGLSRRLAPYADYARVDSAELPWKWMAPEAIQLKQLDCHNDVWAFGVTAWEVLSDGATPYGQLDAAKVLDFVKAGNRLKKPQSCSGQHSCTAVWAKLRHCWLTDAAHRPAFTGDKGLAIFFREKANAAKDK